MSTPPVEDIANFRAEVNSRIGQIEKWLERVTVAVERLTENRERILVLEVRLKSELDRQDREIDLLRAELAGIRDDLQKIGDLSNDQNVTIAKLDASKATVLMLVSAAISGLATWLFSQWGGHQ
jgi:chromosome segregation ATPase